MPSEFTIPQRFERQAQTCTAMGSPFYGALCASAARAYESDADFAALLDRHAQGARLVLRLLGAAHFRALQGEAPAIAAHYPSTGGDGDADAAWEAIRCDVRDHPAHYDGLLERPVQTNEVARAMPVLAAMLAVAHETQAPMRIFEIGSSAGLILNFDRYRYEGDGWSWGDPASPLTLRNRTAGGAPANLDAPLQVEARRGCDLHPLDVAEPADANTLLSYVWADQRERFERLQAAIDIARAHPVEIEPANGIQWLAHRAVPVSGAVSVALHTVVTEHLPRLWRQKLDDALEYLASRASLGAPLAWVRMEPGARGYDTTATIWPGRREFRIAGSDGHAQNLRWNVSLA